MKLEYVAGGETLRQMNRKFRMFTDGKRLALVNDYDAYLLEAYAITEFVIESDYHDYSFGSEMLCLHASHRVRFAVQSQGRFKHCSSDAVRDMFLSANDMSVDDLLALAYQKLNQEEEG